MWGEWFDPERAVAVAGLSAQVSLKTLCLAKQLLRGDDLTYERGFPEFGTQVRRSAKIISIDADGVPTAKWTIDATGEEHSISFESLNKLEHAILDSDGRVPRNKRANGNAWKAIRVFRKGRSLGRVWQIRKQYYEKNN